MGIMLITMNDDRVTTIAEVREIIKHKGRVSGQAHATADAYAWIGATLLKLRYHKKCTTKRDRRDIITYIVMLSGYKRSWVKQLTVRYRKHKGLRLNTAKRNRFPIVYTAADVALLLETDNAHGRLGGPATKRLMERAYFPHDDLRFERLRHISVSHLYNLRKRRQYTSEAQTYTKTNPVKIPIGMRRKPDHGGKPGFLRVDSVHQGDLDKEKGVYHINLVDEVTQWEIILCVEGISEFFLLPALEAALSLFPFHIVNFHSDNGSEYINYRVAEMLDAMMVKQTKSRSRHSNDNALVECKNGAVIRKHMGYVHIPKTHAGAIDAFYRTHMDEYLNYHRVCAFATDAVDAKGKMRKKYDTFQTPYERLASLPEWEQYLRTGVTRTALDAIAARESDLVCAQKMQKAKDKLFETIRKC